MLALRRAALFVIGALLVASACDKAPLTAPTNSAVTLFAASTFVALNGSVEITANVTEPGGIPVQNGTQVTFTTTIGTFDPIEARTNGGKATVRLIAGAASGVAQVRAFSGGAQAEALEIRVGAAGATALALSPTPSSLGPNGGTVDIVAVVTGADNRRLAGVPVSFSASTGVLRETTATSDWNGEARTQLTTTREATVTATVGSVTQTTTVRVSSVPSITITPPAGALGEGETGTFNLVVQPQTNGDPIRDVVIDFGDGQRMSLGVVSGSRTIQKAYDRKGRYTVTVTVTDTGNVVTQATTTVSVEERSIVVNLSASPTNPQRNAVVQFTATASGTNIVGYYWNLGDGDYRQTTGPNTTKAYETSGRRRITVEVVNGAGQRGLNTIEIVVQ